MSNLRSENDRLRTQRSKIIGDEDLESMNVSMLSDTDNQASPQKMEPLQPLENA